MYLELLTTVAGLQNDLGNAYTASGRMRELGLYFLAMNQATAEFFKYIEPPAQMKHVHEAFLEWQQAGIQALREQLDSDELVNSKATEQHIQAGQAFADVLAGFTTSPEGPKSEAQPPKKRAK